MANEEDYFIAANSVGAINEEQYKKLDVLIHTTEAISRSLYQSVYLIDYYKKGFLYVSENPSFLWNRQSVLPLERIYGINPLEAIHSDVKFNYWHVGRFAIDSTSGISTFTLFKSLMALAVQPIVGDSDSYMVAEIDCKLLKVMNALGFETNQLGDSLYYLTSETAPISSSKQGIMGFYSKYGYLCGVA